MTGRNPSSPADRRKNPARKKAERRKSNAPPPETGDATGSNQAGDTAGEATEREIGDAADKITRAPKKRRPI